MTERDSSGHGCDHCETPGFDEAYRSALIDRDIAEALSDWDLEPGSATKLIERWRREFSAIDDGQEIRVVTRQGWNAKYAVRDWFWNFPEYAGFLKVNTAGPVRLDNRGPEPVAVKAPIDSPVDRPHDDDLPPTVEIDEADIEFVTGHLAAALASLYRGSDEAIGSVGTALGYIQALGRDLSRSEGAR